MGAQQQKVWRTDRPEDLRQVLALVSTAFNGERWRVITWVPGKRRWLIEGDIMSDADRVVRWRELEPLTIEREDKRQPGVTALVELFKQLNGGRLDRDDLSRKQCHTLLDNMVKLYPETDPTHAAARLIRAVKAHKDTRGWVTSFLTLNRHLTSIINTISKNNAPVDKFVAAAGKLAAD